MVDLLRAKRIPETPLINNINSQSQPATSQTNKNLFKWFRISWNQISIYLNFLLESQNIKKKKIETKEESDKKIYYENTYDLRWYMFYVLLMPEQRIYLMKRY